MGLSVAIVDNSNMEFSNIDEITELAAKVKKECKKYDESYYMLASSER